MFKIRALLIILLNVLLSYHVFSFVMVVLCFYQGFLAKRWTHPGEEGSYFVGLGLMDYLIRRDRVALGARRIIHFDWSDCTTGPPRYR
jgi:hypothetical protein